MQTKERKKPNSGNNSRFNITTRKCEREKRSTSKNGPAGVASRREAERKQIKGETHNFRNYLLISVRQSLDSSTSTDGFKSVDLNIRKRKRVKKGSTSDKFKRIQTKGKIFHIPTVNLPTNVCYFFYCLKGKNVKGLSCVGAKKKKENNR